MEFGERLKTVRKSRNISQ